MYHIEIRQILTLLIDCGDLKIFIINKTELTSTVTAPFQSLPWQRRRASFSPPPPNSWTSRAEELCQKNPAINLLHLLSIRILQFVLSLLIDKLCLRSLAMKICPTNEMQFTDRISLLRFVRNKDTNWLDVVHWSLFFCSVFWWEGLEKCREKQRRDK